jgi:hypothetical protein
LYYGCKEKDTMAARLLIERVDKAATIAGWNATCKIVEFYMCLCDKAIFCWESLQEDHLDLDDWDIIKAEFLKAYQLKYSARTTCANFTNMIQKSSENVNNYHVRVQMAYKRLTDSKLATMATIRLASATGAQAKLKGMNYMAKFFKHQLFLPGLT